MAECTYFAYMLASRPRGTVYIGVTNGLLFRVAQHRDGKGGAFTRRYKVNRLVWYELHDDVAAAIQREKSLKEYPRAWKINLIERENLHWSDLYPALLKAHGVPNDPPPESWVPGTRPGMTAVGR